MYTKDDYYNDQLREEEDERMEVLGLIERWNYLLFQMNARLQERFTTSPATILWNGLEAGNVSLAAEESFSLHDDSFCVRLTVMEQNDDGTVQYHMNDTIPLEDVTFEHFEPYLEQSLSTFQSVVQ